MFSIRARASLIQSSYVTRKVTTTAGTLGVIGLGHMGSNMVRY